MAVSDRRIVNALNKRLDALMKSADAPAELTEKIVLGLAFYVAADVGTGFKSVEPAIKAATPRLLEAWRAQASDTVRAEAKANEPAPEENSWQAVLQSAIALGRQRGPADETRER